MRALLATMVVTLATASAAVAGEVRSPELSSAMTVASGQPTVDVSCEPGASEWDAETRRMLSLPGANVSGYTLRATRRVRLAPWVCANLTPDAPLFGAALYVIGAEAARVAGHQAGAEAVVGCWALTWVAPLAVHVWGVPAVYVPGGTSARAARAFTATSLGQAVATARALHARGQPQYRRDCR